MMHASCKKKLVVKFIPYDANHMWKKTIAVFKD